MTTHDEQRDLADHMERVHGWAHHVVMAEAARFTLGRLHAKHHDWMDEHGATPEVERHDHSERRPS